MIFWHASAMQKHEICKSEERAEGWSAHSITPNTHEWVFAGMKIWRVGTQITEHYDPVLAPVGALKCFARRGHHVFMNCFMHLWSTGLSKLFFTLNISLFRKASCLHSQVTAMGKRYCWASLKVTYLTFHKVKLYVKPKSEMPSDLNPDLL